MALTANFMQISVSLDVSEIGRVYNYAGFSLPRKLDRGAAMHMQFSDHVLITTDSAP